MFSENENSQNVIPELALISDLSPHWQTRFKKAIVYMREHVDSPFNWQNVADECAISASHFHVMFRTVFGETPATYHRRIRLKQVLAELYFEPQKSVLNIALDAGFSTSQSLAKVLQREFKQSAQNIRQQERNDNYQELRDKLEHVVEGESIERRLSENITFSITTIDEQHLYLEKSISQNVNDVMRHWLKVSPSHVDMAVSVSPWQIVEDINSEYQVGYHCEPELANTILPKQCFLSCRVKLKDATSYFSCWEALYMEAMTRGYDINEAFGLLEFTYNVRAKLKFSYDIEMHLPINIID